MPFLSSLLYFLVHPIYDLSFYLLRAIHLVSSNANSILGLDTNEEVIIYYFSHYCINMSFLTLLHFRASQSWNFDFF
uniref:Uncharacterized protein n=1 Tax=Rhizophora mucronata TaxID=61149 RepID=A0A2P2J0K1_RHIMU